MRERLRLRVFLPAAAVALLGVGVSAFAFGSGPGAAPPAPAPRAAAADPADWTDRAAALCAGAQERGRALGSPRSLAALAAVAPQALVLEQRLLTDLRALQPRADDRPAVERLLDLRANQVAAHEQMLLGQDPLAYLGLLARDGDADLERLALELGVPACADDLLPGADADLGALGRLEQELAAHDVVVVLFYTPGSAVDAFATREARAGAGDVRAGFVAVDVTNEDDVAALAGELGVRDAPTLVVVRRNHGAVNRLPGFVDRATVAQAAAIALVS